MSKKLIAVAGVLISVVALWWALHDIDFTKWADALPRIQWVLVRCWRCRRGSLPSGRRWPAGACFITPTRKRVGQGHLLPALLIGYLFNTILPLRTGELVRATVMRLTEKLPIARTLSTILVEKVLDTMTLVLGLGLILPFIELPGGSEDPALISAVLFSGLFVPALGGAIWPEQARRLLTWGLRPVPAGLSRRVQSIADSVLEGLAPLRARAVAPRIAVWSLCAWVFNVVSVYCLSISFGLRPAADGPALVVIATNLVMAIPSGPGYVGLYHSGGETDAAGLPARMTPTWPLRWRWCSMPLASCRWPWPGRSPWCARG